MIGDALSAPLFAEYYLFGYILRIFAAVVALGGHDRFAWRRPRNPSAA